jgi:hypothetical protein
MSVLLTEDNKKYIMDWDKSLDVLKVMEFEPTTWNAQSQQYDYDLVTTHTFGSGSFTPVYGSWYDTTTQTTTANTPTPMYCDSGSGVGINKVYGSNFEVQSAGTYNVQFSVQLDQDSGAGHHIFIWLRKNGVDVPWSASEVAIQGTVAESIPSWNWFIDLAVDDYINIMYYVTNSGVKLKAVSATALKPGIPSVILTMNKISN